jgi:hypothetical protein
LKVKEKELSDEQLNKQNILTQQQTNEIQSLKNEIQELRLQLQKQQSSASSISPSSSPSKTNNTSIPSVAIIEETESIYVSMPRASRFNRSRNPGSTHLDKKSLEKELMQAKRMSEAIVVGKADPIVWGY